MTIKLTREEALQHFKEQLDIFGGEHAEAIKVAIEALQNKSRPFGDCSKCIHTYGTLGCCTTVSNEWVYDCEHGMEQYENTSVPSADRPRGEWIHSPNGIDRDFIWWVCSECGHKIFSETEKDRREFHAYCGRCGADMRGDGK